MLRTATLAVGEQHTDTIVVKAAIIALVTMALHETAASIRDRRAASNPYTVTRDALADLIAELAHLTSTSNTKPAYPTRSQSARSEYWQKRIMSRKPS